MVVVASRQAPFAKAAGISVCRGTSSRPCAAEPVVAVSNGLPSTSGIASVTSATATAISYAMAADPLRRPGHQDVRPEDRAPRGDARTGRSARHSEPSPVVDRRLCERHERPSPAAADAEVAVRDSPRLRRRPSPTHSIATSGQARHGSSRGANRPEFPSGALSVAPAPSIVARREPLSDVLVNVHCPLVWSVAVLVEGIPVVDDPGFMAQTWSSPAQPQRYDSVDIAGQFWAIRGVTWEQGERGRTMALAKGECKGPFNR